MQAVTFKFELRLRTVPEKEVIGFGPRFDRHTRIGDRAFLHRLEDYDSCRNNLSDNLEVVTFLLDQAQSDVDAVDELNNTALGLAAGKGDLDIVKMLIEKGKIRNRIIAGIWRRFIFFRGSRETRQP